MSTGTTSIKLNKLLQSINFRLSAYLSKKPFSNQCQVPGGQFGFLSSAYTPIMSYQVLLIT